MDLTGLSKLAEHVAEREDAVLEAARADEALRRALAERAALPRKAASGSPAEGRRPLTWPPASWRRVALPALAGLAVAVIAALWLFRAPKRADVTFTVGDPARAGVVGEWLGAPATDEVTLRFSDGSRARLEPASRARVVRTSAAGADLVLEAGRALVEVAPRDHTEYRVRSGPFEVLVTGTRFLVAWSSERDEFELDLEEGRVRVFGCGMGEGVSLEPGHRLRASCRPAKFSVSPRGEAPPRVPALAPAPAPSSPSASAVVEARDARATKRSDPIALRTAPVAEDSWAKLARQGYFRKAYDAALAAGFESEAARTGAGDLLLLGDTARLSGHPERAAQVYLSVRQRFAGTPPAAQAAFYLGRLGAAGGAAHWFQVYLDEQPRGPLAEAALGRLLETELRRGDRKRARVLARSYLDRHPAGPHGKTARDVLAAPAED